MLPVQSDFIVHSIFITFNFIGTEAVIFSGFRYSEVFNIGNFPILFYDEIRCVRFPGIHDVIGIDGLIFIINIVEIKEVRDLDFLMGSQYFVLDRDSSLCSGVNDFPLKVFQIASHR